LEGRIKVLDVRVSVRNHILLLSFDASQNILDDGMDGLSGQLRPICDWIDHAHATGGKVLVHCRVGVSRSATVTVCHHRLPQTQI
jgi:protein-tyrosine phosphatase